MAQLSSVVLIMWAAPSVVVGWPLPPRPPLPPSQDVTSLNQETVKNEKKKTKPTRADESIASCETLMSECEDGATHIPPVCYQLKMFFNKMFFSYGADQSRAAFFLVAGRKNLPDDDVVVAV